MRYLRYFAFLMVLAMPAVYSHAQVAVGIGVHIGPDYGLYNAPPVCAYGYYSDYPFDCAPYGYWDPQWFADGEFIGAGPWYRFYFTHPEFFRGGFVRFGDRGFRRFDFDDRRGFRDGGFRRFGGERGFRDDGFRRFGNEGRGFRDRGFRDSGGRSFGDRGHAFRGGDGGSFRGSSRSSVGAGFRGGSGDSFRGSSNGFRGGSGGGFRSGGGGSHGGGGGSHGGGHSGRR